MLSNMVVIVDPMMNPDGRDRFAKSLEQYRGTAPNYDDQSMLHTGDWPISCMKHGLIIIIRRSSTILL